MGCISSKKQMEDIYLNFFQVMNVDEHGNNINSGQIEITDADLVFYQKGKSPIKWPLRTLRKYGFDAEHFSFECGRRCQTGPGIYAFRCSRAEELFNLLQIRIQTRNNDNENPTGATNFGNLLTKRDSTYLEPASVRRPAVGVRCFSQNGEVSRLSSVGSASGSVGPLSPQSITSTPTTLDSVPFVAPLPLSRPLSQNLYANEEIIVAVTEDLEETNNNKTLDETFTPPVEYLNSTVLENLPKQDLSSPVNGNHNTPEEVTSPIIDNNRFYVNILPATDQVTPQKSPVNVQAQSPSNFVTIKWEKSEDSLPNYANFEADINLSPKLQSTVSSPKIQSTISSPKIQSTISSPKIQSTASSPTKKINYIVLDLESTGDSLKSPTSSQPPDISKKPPGGYVAIDFKKTVALLQSVNPDFDTDSESSRKTRHSSNINNLSPQERHSSSVSD